MKIAVSTYSFSRYIEEGRLTQLDCISKAKELGFDAIEVAEILPHEGSTAEQYAVQLRNEAERCGIPIVNYTVSADFINGCGGDAGSEIGRVKRQVDIAALLGAKGMRHDASWGASGGKYRSFSKALPLLADCCREITEYASTLGIRTMVENHGFFCQDSERVEALVNLVNHSNFGWLVDIGNFLCVDEDPASAVGRAAPYAFYVHAKDFHVKSGEEANPGGGFFRSRGGNYLRGAVLGHGAVPISQCLYALKHYGYDGYVAIEFEGIEDPFMGIGLGLENLKRYIKEIF